MSEQSENIQAAPDVAGQDEAPLDGALAVDAKAKSPIKLIIIGVVLIAGAAAFTIYKKHSPASASASSSVAMPVEQQTISTFLAQRENGVAMMQSMLRNTQKLVQQFLAYPTTAQVPLSDLKTNPFRRYATTSMSPDSEAAKKKREEERLAAIRAVQNLTLQSVIHSDTHRACMINNTLYTEGQQVDSFTVEKISGNAVVVKSGAYRFELKMQK
jgi:hypothetical protein